MANITKMVQWHVIKIYNKKNRNRTMDNKIIFPHFQKCKNPFLIKSSDIVINFLKNLNPP